MIAESVSSSRDVSADAWSPDLSAPLVVGFGVTGQAVARSLLARGHRPVVFDDHPAASAASTAVEFGLDLHSDPLALAGLITTASVVLPSPGVPDHHPVFEHASAASIPVASEFDLARMWDDRPIVAITGTNGKTSVTMMVTDALRRSGIESAAVGNTPLPLVAALDDEQIETFVVEASSFRLAHSRYFSPAVATWMNFAPDHLDAHASLEAYEQAKASIWSNLEPGAVVVANAEDAVVMSHVPAGSNVVTFGIDRGDWYVADGSLCGPDGPVLRIDDLARRQPHDLSNAACMAATATAAGADLHAVISTLTAFEGLPHRLALIGEWSGVRWFNDSKATVPQATLAAVGGFDSVVLIAGGRNKGLDLSVLANSVPPVHTVVAIGDAADEVADVFAEGKATVVRAESMASAIGAADNAASPGDAVLLSPACTSFDAYANYAERGDHFTELVTSRFS